jgi:hypothetical protein
MKLSKEFCYRLWAWRSYQYRLFVRQNRPDLSLTALENLRDLITFHTESSLLMPDVDAFGLDI